MRAALAVILLSLAVDAQTVTPPGACGPKSVKFDVQSDDSRHTLAQPEPGKALVYIIQDQGRPCQHLCTTLKIGLDGAWVGAIQGNSWFAFPLDPGEHHLCVNWQSRLGITARLFGLSGVAAEAGRSYYFRARLLMTDGQSYLDLEPADRDFAAFFVSSFPASVPRQTN